MDNLDDTYTILMARAKRKFLIENAGEHFVDRDHPFIQWFRERDDSVYFGIRKNEHMYTIIGENGIYYSTKDGEGLLSADQFSNLLHEKTLEKTAYWRLWGSSTFSHYSPNFRYLSLENDHKVWLKNKQTMLGLWNIALWFEKRHITA